jgi:hypothetical protein
MSLVCQIRSLNNAGAKKGCFHEVIGCSVQFVTCNTENALQSSEWAS